jgi:hypothetical protein
MQLTPVQKKIINADARFKVVIAGRRGGKTYCSIASLAKHARIPNSKCLYIAPTHSMCRQILWSDLKDLLGEKKWIKRVNESNLEITLVNNSIIMLRSADTPDRMRGLGVDHVVIDEAADISEETWTAVIRPALSDRQGTALIISSPKGRNWLYTVFQNAKHLPDWYALQFTTAEGGNVPPEEIESAKMDLDERTFKQEYEATFVEYAGVIYYAFGEHNIREMQFGTATNHNIPLYVGGDFNISPICAVVGFKHANGLHIYDEIEIYGSDTQEMATEIQQRYPNRQVHFFPDAAGAQRRTSAVGGITDHIILKNAGFKLHVGSVNPAVKDRIASVNSAFKSTDGQCKLTIDPKCKKLINGLRKHVYREGTRLPEKDGAEDFSHFNDALGYMVNNLYPVKVDVINNYGRLKRRV